MQITILNIDDFIREARRKYIAHGVNDLVLSWSQDEWDILQKFKKLEDGDPYLGARHFLIIV